MQICKLTVLNEVVNDLHEAATAGQSEGSLLCLLGLSVDVGTVLNQKLNHILVAFTGSLHQGSVAAYIDSDKHMKIMYNNNIRNIMYAYTLYRPQSKRQSCEPSLCLASRTRAIRESGCTDWRPFPPSTCTLHQ